VTAMSSLRAYSAASRPMGPAPSTATRIRSDLAMRTSRIGLGAEDLALAQGDQVAAIPPILKPLPARRRAETPRAQLAQVDFQERRAVEAIVAERWQQRRRRSPANDAAALHAGPRA